MEKPGHVRVTTAARILGLSPARISQLKQDGLLKGCHGWITIYSLDQYKDMLGQKRAQKDDPKSGVVITPVRYSPEERKALKKAKSYGGSSKKVNHHYIVK